MPESESLRDLIEPSPTETQKISDLWRSFADLLDSNDLELLPTVGRVQLRWDDGRFRDLPPSVARGLLAVLGTLAKGNAVAVVPADNELTTQEAADLLGVSRTYLVRLTDRGDLPCRWVGTHRRLRVEDVISYRRALQTKRHDAVREVTKESKRLGL